ncbi:Os01g0583525, partial [Oryza sativa Japonica Group]
MLCSLPSSSLDLEVKQQSMSSTTRMENRVVVHLEEVEVVEVEAEVVGNGGDEAGLACPGRAVEEVPSLPRPA